LGARTVDVDLERRQRRRLVDARIGHPVDVAHLRQKPVGVGEIRAEVVATHLQIDGRGRAEIQDLADDVRGQK